MLETSINQNFLSLTENIDEDIGECNYSENKEFGDCNRKSTMATSNDESFTELNDVEFLYQEMKKKYKREIK